MFTTIVATLLAAPAFAGGAKAVSVELDVNGDGIVERAEFERYFETRDLYADVDLNQDGYIAPQEWDAMKIRFDTFQSFAMWDADDDRYLTGAEFRDGLYSAFDENGNGHWDPQEWHQAGDAGLWEL